MTKKIAIFHPWIKSRGGSEKTILEILKNIKNVDLYTWVYDKENTFEEFKNFSINVIGKKSFKKFSRSGISRGFFLLNCLFSKIPLEKYDLFLLSTSGLAEFILFRNYKPGKTYAYVYTPLREATDEIIKWNLKNRYKSLFSKIIYKTAVNVYRIFEKLAWKKIDTAIFISELSLERAKKRNLIKNKKVEIVYPPTDIENLKEIKTKNLGYFLYPSRINTPKRQDLLIKSWETFEKKHPNEKLIIAGSLENEKYYEKIKKLAESSRNIEIKTNLNKKEFLKLYKECKAVIFVPFMEDFGIVPFEALALGKPLIAVNKGGYVKLIEKTPQYYPIKELFYEDKMIKEINRVLESFMTSKIVPKKIENIAYNTNNFINNLNKILKF
ncbi:MAG TPA: glycosyltransferase [Candidatus Pacearchaeota archaeon]|nr:glycosyltransferase [Candidatus Pacearchaeota archaeon]